MDMETSPAAPTVELEVVLQRRDLTRCLLWNFWRHPTCRYFVIISAIMLLLLIANSASTGHWRHNAFGMAFMALVLVLLPGSILFSSARQFSRMNPEKFRTQYGFSNESVSLKGTLGESRLQWRAFERVCESPGYFYLYIGRNLFYIVPKRCFSSEADLQTLRQMVRQKLGSSAKIK
jgi:hypothetical protein